MIPYAGGDGFQKPSKIGISNICGFRNVHTSKYTLLSPNYPVEDYPRFLLSPSLPAAHFLASLAGQADSTHVNHHPPRSLASDAPWISARTGSDEREHVAGVDVFLHGWVNDGFTLT